MRRDRSQGTPNHTPHTQPIHVMKPTASKDTH
jgi:hypothetical protein